MRIGFLVAAVVAAVVVILAFQFGERLFGEEEAIEETQGSVLIEDPVEEPLERLPEPVLVAPKEPLVVLPELDASDAFVVERFEDSGLPENWLDREDLVRRLAVVIDNAPRGEYPRRQLGFLAPSGGFKVIKRGDEIFLDPSSYARYDAYLDALESVDPALLAETISLLEPLIAQGLAELGNQGGVNEQITSAIDRITSLPLLSEEVRLLQPEVLYEFADPQLEAKSPLEKQALRLGPENLRRLQSYLGEFQSALAAAG